MTYGTFSSTTPRQTVSVESLSFVDVSIGNRGDFLGPNALNDFLRSPLGQAQTNLLDQQIRAQGVTPNSTTIERALLAEQASQTFGSRRPDIVADNAENPDRKMTETQLVAAYGPGAKPPSMMVDPAPVLNRGMGLA